MRAKEFIVERFGGKIHGKPKSVSDSSSDPLPGVFVQQQLRNTDPYMQYRYGMAVAAARAVKHGYVNFDQESAWAENLTQVMYAPEDEETIKLASDLMGVSPTRITDNSSHEPSKTNILSPVAKTKKNRYGV